MSDSAPQPRTSSPDLSSAGRTPRKRRGDAGLEDLAPVAPLRHEYASGRGLDTDRESVAEYLGRASLGGDDVDVGRHARRVDDREYLAAALSLAGATG